MLAANGTQSVALGGLLSFASPEGEVLGLARVYPQGDSLWLVHSGLGTTAPSIYADAVIEVDKESGRIKTMIDLWEYEAANNPDGNEIDSNVNDIAWGADGTLYIVEAGANTLYAWSADGGLEVVQTWAENSVPVAIRFASNGDMYIGFLGAGLGPGAAKIEHRSADGSELIGTFEGLTAVTDIALDADDNLYAVQFFQFGDQGPAPSSGSVVMVSADGITPVAEGLSFPFGLAQAPDGSWAVSVNSAFLPAGSGAIVKIGGEM
jgi:hypothetical protein